MRKKASECFVSLDCFNLGVVDTTDDQAIRVLYWVYGTSAVLDSPSVRDWAQDVMLSRGIANPGYHALVAAGLLFTQASRHLNIHDDEDQCGIQVATGAPRDSRAGLPTFQPTTIYISVFKALRLVRARNKMTAIIKATDEVRMQKLQKEEMIVERCCTGSFWLDGNNDVSGYAWFLCAVGDGNLVSSSDAVSALGQLYG